MQLPNSKKNNP
jgi:Na+-driven multidrug efflux pump